jgi:hypothetical protein
MHGLVLEGGVSADDTIKFGLSEFKVEGIGGGHHTGLYFDCEGTIGIGANGPRRCDGHHGFDDRALTASL